MTEDEIRTRYRQAKNPKAQIYILAELNDCKPREIRAILGVGAQPHRTRAGYPDDFREKVIAYVRKSEDYKEAAQHFGLSKSCVLNWCVEYGVKFYRQSLSPHQKAEAQAMIFAGKSDEEVAAMFNVSIRKVIEIRKEMEEKRMVGKRENALASGKLQESTICQLEALGTRYDMTAGEIRMAIQDICIKYRTFVARMGGTVYD